MRALKIVLVAPMPNANESTTTAVNPGLLRSVRTAYRRSLSSASGIDSGILEWPPVGGREPMPTALRTLASRKRPASAVTAKKYQAHRDPFESSPRRFRRVYSS